MTSLQGSCTTPGHHDHPRRGDRWVCDTCVTHLTNDLSSISALWVELEVTLTRQDVMGGDGGAPSAEVPLLFKESASDARWVLINTIGTWGRLLADHLGVQPPIRPAKWLRLHVHELSTHPAAGEAVDEIASMVRLATSVIDRPREKLFAGACGSEDCDTVLWAKPGDDRVRCRECDAVFDVQDRREHMLIAASVLSVTRTEGASWISLLMDKRVPEPTWQAWVSRGKLHQVGSKLDSRGKMRATYRFGDMQDLAINWMARKGKAA